MRILKAALCAILALNVAFAIAHSFGIVVPYYNHWIGFNVALVVALFALGFLPGLHPGVPALRRVAARVRR